MRSSHHWKITECLFSNVSSAESLSFALSFSYMCNGARHVGHSCGLSSFSNACVTQCRWKVWLHRVVKRGQSSPGTTQMGQGASKSWRQMPQVSPLQSHIHFATKWMLFILTSITAAQVLPVALTPSHFFLIPSTFACIQVRECSAPLFLSWCSYCQSARTLSCNVKKHCAHEHEPYSNSNMTKPRVLLGGKKK